MTLSQTILVKLMKPGLGEVHAEHPRSFLRLRRQRRGDGHSQHRQCTLHFSRGWLVFLFETDVRLSTLHGSRIDTLLYKVASIRCRCVSARSLINVPQRNLISSSSTTHPTRPSYNSSSLAFLLLRNVGI